MERFGFCVVPFHPGLVTSDYGVHEIGVTVFGVQHVLDMTRIPNQSIIFLQWKSDKSTKHYLTQMLLFINWSYWQVGKNSQVHMKVQGRLMQDYSLKSTRFLQKYKVWYFPNRVVYIMLGTAAHWGPGPANRLLASLPFFCRQKWKI